jgi:hypothetical protein
MKDLELNYRSLRLARDLKKQDLSAEEKSRLLKDLQDVVSEEFDVRQQIRQLEIDEQAQKLRDLIKDLEDKLKKRDEVKADLIKKRVDDLQEKTPRLDW